MGVWGCPWPLDFSGKSPMHQGKYISPAHAQIREKKTFSSLFQHYGDPLAILRQETSSGLHLFGFYSSNPHWFCDADATKRLEPYLTKTYVHQAESNEEIAHVHGKITQLVKQKPELIQSWMKEMFQKMIQSECGENSNKSVMSISA